ncbi:Uncharacterised protein [Mycobacteroides abscessus subsp. abscessus]|nr:Uncharacterised protein [Mycobacteroides abscessus subsp. abscessus]
MPSTYSPPASCTSLASVSAASLNFCSVSSQAAWYSSGVSTGSRPCSRRCLSARKSGLPPSTMSVPRPAMLVATVMAPRRPASAMMAASCSWYLALSTLCGTRRLVNCRERYSERSTLVVPMRTGCPFSYRSTTSSTTAMYLASSVL